MKNIAILTLLVAGLYVCCGCDGDKSGATQQMPAQPKSDQSKSNLPAMPGNLPPEAQKGAPKGGN